MKSTRASTPRRLKGMILVLSIAAMATQVSGASAAPELSGSRSVTSAGGATAARAAAPAQPAELASLLRGPPVSRDWALLVAGLLGVCAIGRRRMTAFGGRGLDLHGSRGGRR